LSENSPDLPQGWQKAKVGAEIIGLILIPFLIFYLADKNTKELKERDQQFMNELKKKESADRQAAVDKEIGVRYTEISIAILRESPSKQTKVLREWAIDVFKRYSPIRLTPKLIEELKQKPLPISVSYTMKGGAVAGGSADVKVEHAPKPSQQSQ
jgi:hypothetical protein